MALKTDGFKSQPLGLCVTHPPTNMEVHNAPFQEESRLSTLELNQGWTGTKGPDSRVSQRELGPNWTSTIQLEFRLAKGISSVASFVMSNVSRIASFVISDDFSTKY